MNNPEFLLRVSTDPAFGAGHLARMRALRSCFDAPVKWFIDPGTKADVRPFIPAQDDITEEHTKESISQLLSFQKLTATKLIVCDSYQIKCNALASSDAKIVFFCDDDTESCSANITIVNCQPGATPRANCLCGPRYIPIDARGKQQKKIDFDKFVDPINCLVSFGAVDKNNLTALALEALSSEKNLRTHIRPICLIGRYFRHKKAAETLLALFPKSEIITGCDSVLNLPIDCPLAIGAPGLSHAERLFLGMATVLIPQNNAHQILCDKWQAESCGIVASAQADDIRAKLQFLMADGFKWARALSRHGQEVIDGKGAYRITASIGY